MSKRDLLLNASYQAIWGVSRNFGIAMSGSLGGILDEYVYAQPQLPLIIFGTFAGTGLMLMMIGVFSVMAYTVSAQTHDIGVRMALGAQPGAILLFVLKKGILLVAAGTLLGVAASLSLVRFCDEHDLGRIRTDPWTFVVVGVGVLVAGLAACVIPATRAARDDPLVMMRYDRSLRDSTAAIYARTC